MLCLVNYIFGLIFVQGAANYLGEAGHHVSVEEERCGLAIRFRPP